MTLSRIFSLHGRLILAFTFVILLTVVLTGIVSSIITTNRFEALVTEQEMSHTKEIVPVLEAYYALNGSWEGVEQLFTQPEELQSEVSAAQNVEEMASALTHDHLLMVTDATGTVVYDGLAPGVNGAVDLEQLPNGVPLYNRPGDEIVGYVVVASDLGLYSEQQTRFLEGLSSSLLLSGALAGLAALLVAAVVAREVTAPVTALTAAAQELASGRTTEPLPVETDDELGQMSAAFNQMAAALQQQRELRKQLVNDLAHELGTPLSVIHIEMKALRNGQQTVSQTFSKVEQEIELLRNLVNDLELLTTSQAQMQLQKEPLELAFLVRRAVERWRPQAEARDITLTFEEPDRALPFTKADISRLIQVLGNLINNALRHTAGGGQVTVSVRLVSAAELDLPAAAEAQHWLITTIQDTGEGIAERDLPYIFDRFYRTDDTRLHHRGQGLGLSIVKQIVEAHGGQVWVTSVQGEGSVFGFSLPVEEG